MHAMVRVAPNAAPRDVPLDPTLDAKGRLFLSEGGSDMIWRLILSDPSHEVIENMDLIARTALAPHNVMPKDTGTWAHKTVSGAGT